MSPLSSFRLSPWDSAVFGLDAYEIPVLSREALENAAVTPGHYTVRLNPLASKRALNEYGFYYCDTLIEPYCTVDRFTGFDVDSVSVSSDSPLASLLAICNGAFSHGRFHRDFNLPSAAADQRYNEWLKQLHGAGKVYGLLHMNQLAGFIAVDGNRLVLHAISESWRGRGLAKYLWTPVCRKLFENGGNEVVSSVSATNLPVVNLYASLGFRFRNPVDIYHCFVP
jgi:ribosomal protein S18 acetylase RimI-like enzyme